jgi:hypothetical protein
MVNGTEYWPYYDAQSAIVAFVGIIQYKNISCHNKATSFLLVGVLRQRKKADFSRNKMCCL